MREFLQFLVLFAIYASGAIVGVIVMALVSAGAQADRCAECQERQNRERAVRMRRMDDYISVQFADVRPVVQGKWKDSVDKLDMLAGRHEYHCSCCGEMAHYFVGGTEYWFDTHEPNFCSHCGADMRKEDTPCM